MQIDRIRDWGYGWLIKSAVSCNNQIAEILIYKQEMDQI